MEEVNCYFCHSRIHNVIFSQSGYDQYLDLISPKLLKEKRAIVECPDCKLIYRNPQLDEDEVKILYEKFRDYSIRDESPDEYFDRITCYPKGESENIEKIEWLAKYYSCKSEVKNSLLDIGCGGGVFIHTFRKYFHNWEMFGVEPTKSFADLAKRRTGAVVIAEQFNKNLFENSKFDLITINQVLEHIKNPINFLQDVAHLLKPNGQIYLEVPSASDLNYLPSNHDRFQSQHFYIFNISSLNKVIENAGFRVKKIEEIVTLRKRRNLVALISLLK
jgi:2-polyprenyl-3-methyl-5-hydroxy-6-metoxy-1,4-benzoquinol methylase